MSTPKIIQFPGTPAKRGYSPPKLKWDRSCKWCQGSGFTQGLRGQEPCTGCAPKDEPADTWPKLIRDMIVDRFGSTAWQTLQGSREAQVRAFMIADMILRQITPEPDKVERLRIVTEAIPLSAGEARKLARAIMSERREWE